MKDLHERPLEVGEIEVVCMTCGCLVRAATMPCRAASHGICQKCEKILDSEYKKWRLSSSQSQKK